MAQGLILDVNGNIIGAGPVPLVGIPAAFSFNGNIVTVDAPQLIPLSPVPNQRLAVTLSNQACILFIYTKHIQIPVLEYTSNQAPQNTYPSPGTIPTVPPIYQPIDPLFIDIYLNNVLMLGGIICYDRNLIVRNAYFGFIGDFSFIDTAGTEDPQVSDLGDRWQLCYYPNIVLS